MKTEITVSIENHDFLIRLTAETDEEKQILKSIDEFRSKSSSVAVAPINMVSSESNEKGEITSVTLSFCWDHYLSKLIKKNLETTETFH